MGVVDLRTMCNSQRRQHDVTVAAHICERPTARFPTSLSHIRTNCEAEPKLTVGVVVFSRCE